MHRILRTNEVDATDAPIAHAAVTPFGAAAVPGDNFGGTDRKAAKLAISSAQTEVFSDLSNLIGTLPTKKMTGHKPKIATDANSGRVAAENRNVRLRAVLYAASHEADNDFH